MGLAETTQLPGRVKLASRSCIWRAFSPQLTSSRRNLLRLAEEEKKRKRKKELKFLRQPIFIYFLCTSLVIFKPWFPATTYRTITDRRVFYASTQDGGNKRTKYEPKFDMPHIP